MKPISELTKNKPWLGWLLFFATAVIVFLVGLFASSIIERRSEAVTLQMVKPINDWEPRNEVWGENYPREFESYLKTLIQLLQVNMAVRLKEIILKNILNLL